MKPRYPHGYTSEDCCACRINELQTTIEVLLAACRGVVLELPRKHACDHGLWRVREQCRKAVELAEAKE